jgi:hypothetical protein
MTLNEKLATFFRNHPREWVDGKVLAEIAGGYAWRSRCSDVRTKYGMTIENRQRRVTVRIGVLSGPILNDYIVSEYRYVPREAVRPPETADLNTWGLR